MRRGMKVAAATIAFMLIAAAAFGQIAATVQSVAGKVEVRTGSGAWQTATEGMRIGTDTTVSTGFASSAVLNLGRSVLEVGQLTRLTVEELVEREGTVSTDVFVPVGRVRANVQTAEGRSADFDVRTPLSTAAVRGTQFEYDGWSLAVSEGVVEFANAIGQSRTITAGQVSVTTGTDVPSDPADEQEGSADLGDDEEGGDGGEGTGTIYVRWDVEE